MNVMVFCEYSAIVRDAFRDRGHNAWSLDLLPTEGDPNYHIVGDAVEYVKRYGWNTPNGKPIDLLIGHPPCQYLANSGVRWLYKDGERDIERWKAMYKASDFFMWFLNADVPMIAVENPVQHKHAMIRKPNQYVQPFEYGHPETKKTGLWLKGLPLLTPTDNVHDAMRELPMKEQARVHYSSPGPNRWKERSRFYPGIAEAMAKQYGEWHESTIGQFRNQKETQQ